MPENTEIKEILDTCSSLSLANKERVYDVASALKYAEKTAINASNTGLAGESDKYRDIIDEN